VNVDDHAHGEAAFPGIQSISIDEPVILGPAARLSSGQVEGAPQAQVLADSAATE
jgi:hypothetical protein